MPKDDNLLQEAWNLFLDTTGATPELVAAELTRMTMTGLMVTFYHQHMVPRGYPRLHPKTASNLLTLRGEVPDHLKTVIDNAIIAGYHAIVHNGAYDHRAACDHLSDSLAAVKQAPTRSGAHQEAGQTISMTHCVRNQPTSCESLRSPRLPGMRGVKLFSQTRRGGQDGFPDLPVVYHILSRTWERCFQNRALARNYFGGATYRRVCLIGQDSGIVFRNSEVY